VLHVTLNQAVSYAHADQLSPWIGDLEQT